MRPGRKHRTSKTLGIVLVVGVIAAGTYAFTNANTVQANNAGDGAYAVSGYAVSSLDYNETSLLPLGDQDPTTVETVDFFLDGPADRVTVQLSQDAGKDGWHDCTGDLINAAPSGFSSWTCDVGGFTALDVENFRVLAYEDSNTPELITP